MVRRSWVLALLLGVAASTTQLLSQRGGPPPLPASPRATAPVDLTGYWVSLVPEDWRFRVVTPPKGDRVRALIRSGATLNQVQAARPTADYDTRYGAVSGPWTTDMFVEAVYRSLAAR